MRKAQLEGIVFRKKGNEVEFLLLRRIPEKGGFWQPVTGGWEEGEEKRDGMLRELKEEAGIRQHDIMRIIENVHYFEMSAHYLTGERTGIVKEYVFGIEVKPETRITIDENIYPEHDAIKWTTLEESLQLLKWQDNKDAFMKLYAILQ